MDLDGSPRLPRLPRHLDTPPPSPQPQRPRPGRPRGKKKRLGVEHSPPVINSSPGPASKRSPEPRRLRSVSTGTTPVKGASRSSPIEIEDDIEEISTPSSIPRSEQLRSVEPASETKPRPRLIPTVSAPEEITQSTPTRNGPTPARRSPLSRSRTAPAATYGNLEATAVDQKIAELLRTTLTGYKKDNKNKKELEKIGNNYVLKILTSTNSKKLMKIGFTKGSEQTRINDIQNLCDHREVIQKHDPEHVPIRLYERGEKLMHRELLDFQFRFECGCNVQHREYFDIDEDTALEVVQRWRRFCQLEPYDSNGRLRPFWMSRLKAMEHAAEGETSNNHDERAERWNRFMTPTRWDKFWFELTSPSTKKLFHSRWQVIACVESFCIAFLTWPSFPTFLLFGFLLSWAYAESQELELPFTTNTVTATKKTHKRIPTISSLSPEPQEEDLPNKLDVWDESDVEMNERSEPLPTPAELEEASFTTPTKPRRHSVVEDSEAESELDSLQVLPTDMERVSETIVVKTLVS